ncbi:Demethylmenaquinone methyltransferase protein [Marine Group I thaumarchaeote SCGC AAA799-P11]|uniref:Demethylmenaquinone methyltransferase protein n=1 Tax=Marine Group I thaumarchaeote SCGC AAA799-P11 TaxID=1502295 RepID=A0A087RZ89_9ARCH|nr:Demethylmenaquinone methyltransferase protein [Marine Group I thaumarchaeote SCGC AAA799-P11]
MSKHWFIAHLIKKYTNGKNIGLDVGVGKDNWSDFKKCDFIDVDINKQSKSDIIIDLEQHLPFKDSFFDVVISINVLNYVKKSRQVMKEINRVLKMDGIFVCIVDNPNSNNEKDDTWSQTYLDRILSLTGFKTILKNNLKDFLYAKWFNKTSVYAFAVVKKIENYETPLKKDVVTNKKTKQEIKWAKSYNIKTTHPED